MADKLIVSKRHAWIDDQIELFFNEKETEDELG